MELCILAYWYLGVHGPSKELHVLDDDNLPLIVNFSFDQLFVKFRELKNETQNSEEDRSGIFRVAISTEVLRGCGRKGDGELKPVDS